MTLHFPNSKNAFCPSSPSFLLLFDSLICISCQFYFSFFDNQWNFFCIFLNIRVFSRENCLSVSYIHFRCCCWNLSGLPSIGIAAITLNMTDGGKRTGKRMRGRESPGSLQRYLELAGKPMCSPLSAPSAPRLPTPGYRKEGNVKPVPLEV